MTNFKENIVFIVGLGAPENLYKNYLVNLKKYLPQTEIFILEWWKQADFGVKALKSYIGNSKTILIAHSAGGVIALQALIQNPASVKKIIMLDSHFLSSKSALPTVSHMLDLMLIKDKENIKIAVEFAYAPILANNVAFNKALEFAIEWVNQYFNQACAQLKMTLPHSALHLGFTNSSYQVLNPEDEKAALQFWNKFNVDASTLPMGHFDLIDEMNADSINQVIMKFFEKNKFME